MIVRPLLAGDAEVSRRLGHEAFGMPTTPRADAAYLDGPGQHWYGAFDGDQLAARMLDREFDSYFGGTTVPTAGIAGVTVAAEYRSRGLLTPLFVEALRGAKDRGATVSTLFPSAPRIYRRFGYELIADYLTVKLPTHLLTAVPAPTGVTVRRAVEGDLEDLRNVYDSWAQQQNGPLSRRGASFDGSAPALISDVDGVTLALDGAGTMCGFARWNRGPGCGDGSTLAVSDLLATSVDGYRALLRTLGSFSSVTPSTTIDTSGLDVIRSFVPSNDWAVVDASPYMLRVLDVCGSLERRCTPGLTAGLGFTVAGDFLVENDGGYLLEVADGRTSCKSVTPAGGSRTFTPLGLAQMYTGAQSSANLRMVGQLSGGDAAEDLIWDAVFGGRPLHIRNAF